MLLALWNLTLFRRPDRATGNPQVSVLMPARNEARNIAAAVGCALASQDVDLELIVLDDGSTDGTAEIVHAVDDPRLRVARAPALPAGWSGKQHACDVLGKLARYEFMVFVDADVRLEPDAVSRMVGALQRRPDLGLASGFPRQIVVTWSEQLLLPLIHCLLLGYLPIARMDRSCAPALGAGCGQLFVARRTAYRLAGGHAAIRASLHDGITLPRALRRSGQMTGLFDATAFATCRMYRSAAEVWEGLTKNATEGMAKPLALPIWTLILGGGQVLPLALLVVTRGPAAAAALAVGVAMRLMLAQRFRQPWLSAILHPFGVTGLLIVQWAALMRAARGRPATWRGRAYPAQS